MFTLHFTCSHQFLCERTCVFSHRRIGTGWRSVHTVFLNLKRAKMDLDGEGRGRKGTRGPQTKIKTDYQHLYFLRNSRARTTCERPRNSPAPWKREAHVSSRCVVNLKESESLSVWRTILIPNRTLLVRFGDISGEFGRAMVCILTRRSRAKIPMVRPN